MKIESYDKVVKWSYNLARIWAKDHLVAKGVNSSRKFELYKRGGNKLPENFPRRPDEHFKKLNTWKGWSDFFGKDGIHADSNYYSYQMAAEKCIIEGIKNSIEYRTWKNRPERLPARPDQYYKEDWTCWQDFLREQYSLPHRQVFSKLSESDVRIIKHQINLGVSGSILARTFGVSEMQISRIRKGVNWTEV